MRFSSPEAPYRFTPGRSPLLLSIPHGGTYLPPALAARLTPAARGVPDTDWHLATLYAMARDLGAAVLEATHSRYVIDLNRPPDGASLYPGQSVTGLCPIDTFDDEPLYLDRADEPGAAEIDARREAIWEPYHAKLAHELARLRARHGVALLWDAHSIRSVLPRFFEGRLPDLNFGTANGASCAPQLAQALLDLAREESECFSSVLNGRFKGGYITRHYGRPDQGAHAVQLEMTQCSYMDEAPPFAYRDDRAARVQPLLGRLLERMLAFAADGRPSLPAST